MGDLPRLSTAQAAARLGVKPATLYAYVSRGLLSRQRSENGGSTFDALELEAFASTRRARREATPDAVSGRPVVVLDSSLTLIADEELYYRGRSATAFARRVPFERAAEFLWSGEETPELADAFAGGDEVVRRARQAMSALGETARLIEQVGVVVLVAGTCDPVRHESAPDAVRSAGRRMIGSVVDALPPVGREPSPSAPIARRLWSKLSPEEPQRDEVALLNAALVLCMDHDLATSTMAARVAASARAHPYACVSAALGAFDSELHGSASVAAAAMLAEAQRTGRAESAIADQIRRSGGIPGFGHVIYRERDPRAAFLLEAMAALPRFAAVSSVAARVEAVVASRMRRPANLDLALAALAVGAGMRDDAGQVVFAVGRMAGWLAHVAEEYGREALRLRPRSRYTGIRPRS